MGRWEALEGVRGWVGHCSLGDDRQCVWVWRRWVDILSTIMTDMKHTASPQYVSLFSFHM